MLIYRRGRRAMRIGPFEIALPWGNKLPNFTYNRAKAIEALLYVLAKQLDAREEETGYFQTLKAIFWADTYHLSKYYRTIFGDTYKALTKGPVPMHAYYLLDRRAFVFCRWIFNRLIETWRFDTVPFQIKPGSKNHYVIIPTREPMLKHLSKSDMEALDYGWLKVKGKSKEEIQDEVAQHPAYRNTSRNSQMDLKEFFDNVPSKVIEEILGRAPIAQI